MAATSIFGLGMLAGCSSTPRSENSAAPLLAATPDSRCADAGAPLAKLHSDAAGEPNLAIPQPVGWTLSPKFDSEVVRGVLMNMGLRAHDFTPNAVVTLEDLTGAVSTPEQALDAEAAGLAKKGAVVDPDAPASLCGYPSRTVNYTIEGRPATSLIVAAKDDRNKVWAVSIGMQSADPDNPDYRAVKRTILNGFQLSLPSVTR